MLAFNWTILVSYIYIYIYSCNIIVTAIYTDIVYNKLYTNKYYLMFINIYKLKKTIYKSQIYTAFIKPII